MSYLRLMDLTKLILCSIETPLNAETFSLIRPEQKVITELKLIISIMENWFCQAILVIIGGLIGYLSRLESSLLHLVKRTSVCRKMLLIVSKCCLKRCKLRINYELRLNLRTI